MKLVIDIPDEIYNKISAGGWWLESGLTLSNAYDFIKNGIPFSKTDGYVEMEEYCKDINELK